MKGYQAQLIILVPMLHLEEVLQRLYDSEINVTITMLWDGGSDLAFASYMQFAEIGTPQDDFETFIKPEPRVTPTPWHNCPTAGELAEAIHEAALERYPGSEHARTYGCRINPVDAFCC